MSVITVANRIYINPAHADLFEETFSSRARLVDKMPGFISNQLLRPNKATDPYIVLTFWETREHFNVWVKSDSFTQGHARTGTLPKDVFLQPSRIELHEVILDSTRPDLVAGPRGEATPVLVEE
jgi:heme-degrading monooxygenase HmoA